MKIFLTIALISAYLMNPSYASNPELSEAQMSAIKTIELNGIGNLSEHDMKELGIIPKSITRDPKNNTVSVEILKLVYMLGEPPAWTNWKASFSEMLDKVLYPLGSPSEETLALKGAASSAQSKTSWNSEFKINLMTHYSKEE